MVLSQIIHNTHGPLGDVCGCDAFGLVHGRGKRVGHGDQVANIKNIWYVTYCFNPRGIVVQ